MAEAINPLGCPAEHAAAITLRFAGGAIASLMVGGIGAGGFHDFPRIDVITANGQAHLAGRDHIWEQLRWTTRENGGLQGGTPGVIQDLVLPPEALGDTRYTRALQHFFDCIRTGRTPAVGVQDGDNPRAAYP